MLPRLIAGFTGEFPEVTVEVHEDVTDECLRKCVAGRLDVALLALPIDDTGVETEPLFEEELLLVVPEGHALAASKDVNAEDIAGERLILLNEAHCLSRDVAWFCRLKSVTPVTLNYVSQLATVLELVSLGQGVSLVPESARRCDAGTGRAYVPFTGQKPTRTLGFVWHKRKYQRRIVERVRAWARDSMTR